MIIKIYLYYSTVIYAFFLAEHWAVLPFETKRLLILSIYLNWFLLNKAFR
jgi:hypothetical protein